MVSLSGPTRRSTPRAKTVKYGVSDDDIFAITEDGGVLTFNESARLRGDMKEHKVTVTANDAVLIEVTITITNVEEGATVTVVPPRPQIGNAVTASVEDEDGEARTITCGRGRGPPT